MQLTDPRHVAALMALAEADIPVDVQELLVQTGALAKALDAALAASLAASQADVIAVVDGGNSITLHFSEIKSAKAFRDRFPAARITSGGDHG